MFVLKYNWKASFYRGGGTQASPWGGGQAPSPAQCAPPLSTAEKLHIACLVEAPSGCLATSPLTFLSRVLAQGYWILEENCGQESGFSINHTVFPITLDESQGVGKRPLPSSQLPTSG